MDHIYDIFKNWWTRVNASSRAALIAGIVAGVITHLYVLTNKLPHTDELLVGLQAGGYYHGRWMSERYYDWLSHISSPAFDGFVTILMIAISAALVTRILRIHSVTGGILVAVMMVTFPSITSGLTYMYISPIYGIGILLMTLAVWCIRRYRYGWGPAALFIMFSMAGYQAYFPYATALCLLALIEDVLEGTETQMVVRKGFRSLAGLAIGMAFYLWSLQALHVELTDYRGLNNIGGGSVGEYSRAILRSYHRLLQYFVTNPPSYAQGTAHWWNLGCAAVLVLLVVLLPFIRGVHKDPFRLFMYVVFTALTPLGIGLVYVMTISVDNASPLMVYSYCLAYVWIIVLCEHLNADVRWKRALMAVAVILLVLVGYENHRLASDAYYRMYIANSRIYSLYTRIIERVEEQDGYEYGDLLFIAGEYDNTEEFMLDTYRLHDETYADLEGVTLETHLFREPTREKYLRLWLGVENEYMALSDDLMTSIKESDEYKAMPSWPADGCIRRIQDTWVVKMCEE